MNRLFNEVRFLKELWFSYNIDKRITDRETNKLTDIKVMIWIGFQHSAVIPKDRKK